jgi:hypothetical protein
MKQVLHWMPLEIPSMRVVQFSRTSKLARRGLTLRRTDSDDDDSDLDDDKMRLSKRFISRTLEFPPLESSTAEET